MRPHLRVSAVFAQYVGRVLLTQDVNEIDDSCRDGFSHTVVGQCVVSLVESRMRDGGAGDDRLVIAKHVCLPFDRYSEIALSRPQIQNLFRSYAGGNELRSVSCCFNSVLTLGEPIHRSTIK